MRDYRWLSAFLDASEAVFRKLYGKAGEKEMAKPIGRGAGGDVTIEIDRFSEELFIEKFESFNIPAIVLSEEKGKIRLNRADNESPIVLVDPIDGSLNAKRGLPFYSIAVAKTGKTVGATSVGLVVNLSNGDRFYAIKGKGAFRDNYFLERHGIKAKRIKTGEDKNRGVLIAEGMDKESAFKQFLVYRKLFAKIRVFGSVALDLSYLAASAADGFIHPLKSRAFDYAAGKLILEEAGGCLTDPLGNDFDADVTLNGASPFIAARNRAILDEMIKIKSSEE